MAAMSPETICIWCNKPGGRGGHGHDLPNGSSWGLGQPGHAALGMAARAARLNAKRTIMQGAVLINLKKGKLIGAL